MQKFSKLGPTLQRAALVAGLVVGAAGPGAAETLPVDGWLPMELTGTEPPVALGNDPVYGRQLCPPLTRLNLALRRSENLLVDAVTSVPTAGHGLTWIYQLRKDLAWWSGKTADASDLADFLRRGLRRAIAERGGGLWSIPAHRIRVIDEHRVEVAWAEAPVFGPYVMSGRPFFRKRQAALPTDTVGYECVGLYSIAESGLLVPARSYAGFDALPSLQLGRGAGAVAGQSDAWIAFRQASVLPQAAPAGASAGASCRSIIDLPVATLLAWNVSEGPTRDVRFRQIVASLLPEDVLIQAGAAGLGERLSAPIARRHPAYDGQIALRKHDIDAASTALGRLGYKRKAPDEPRLAPGGAPLRLAIATSEHTARSVVAKVLVDSLAAVGIDVELRAAASFAGGQKPAARLGVFALDWPEADYLADFHSKMGRLVGGAAAGDARLDQALERYALTLTGKQPDFAELSRVQGRLAELELVSVVMQHKACVDVQQEGRQAATRAFDTLDPDWFRRLVLGRARNGR